MPTNLSESQPAHRAAPALGFAADGRCTSGESRFAGFCLVALAVPAGALAAFPGPDTDPDPRNDTPNDPGFDPCELDDAETPGKPPERTTYFSEQYGCYGFSPESANTVPLAPLETHPRRHPYLDCAQLDAQGKAANVADGVPQCSQIAGVRADSAWKYSTGDPDTVVAILDTGIRWQDRELLEKVHLNEAELPQPAADRAARRRRSAVQQLDGRLRRNGDGAFNVRDFACDSGVDAADGDTEADNILDGSDLMGAPSDDADDDSNGYKDDIAGWDFFDDDNDPYDASSCCSANGHGTGRAREAVSDTNNGQGDAGMCPDCQFSSLSSEVSRSTCSITSSVRATTCAPGRPTYSRAQSCRRSDSSRNTGRPCSSAKRACIFAPLVCDASMTTVPRESPDITMLRIRKLVFDGGESGQNCDTTAPSFAIRS